MSENQSFTDNPFKKLNGKDYPVKKKLVEVTSSKKQNLEKEKACSKEDSDNLLFLEMVSNVTPLQAKGRDIRPEIPKSTPNIVEDNSLQDFMDGKLEFSLSLTGEYFEGHVIGLDQAIMNKLRAGVFSPSAHVDLHGYNVVQAFETLRNFIKNSWYTGSRTVLIVSGRGKNSINGISILREKLQFWLTQDPFKRVVLAFCTAKPHDGGPGSIYVLLRKFKKKGRIYWERMPADSDLY